MVFGVQLAGGLGMLLGMGVVAMRGMSMVPGRFMLTFLVMLSRLLVMVSRLLVMMGGLFVMFGDLFRMRHGDSPEVSGQSVRRGKLAPDHDRLSLAAMTVG